MTSEGWQNILLPNAPVNRSGNTYSAAVKIAVSLGTFVDYLKHFIGLAART